MMRRTERCGALRAGDAGREVVLAGWAATRRDHGGLIFVDLRDRSGLCQLTFRPEEAPDAHELARSVRNECVLSVRGVVALRGEDNRNPRMPTGDVELVVREMEILNTADPLPFAIEDGWVTLSDATGLGVEPDLARLARFILPH